MFKIWFLACLGPPITVSGLGTMWDEIPMSPASRCLNMSQIHCNLRIFDFLGFAVRPDEAYVYASTGISDPHHILGHAAWGLTPPGSPCSVPAMPGQGGGPPVPALPGPCTGSAGTAGPPGSQASIFWWAHLHKR